MDRVPTADNNLDGYDSHGKQNIPIIDVTNLENSSSHASTFRSNSLSVTRTDDNTVSSVDTSMVASMTTFEDSIAPRSSFAEDKILAYGHYHHVEQVDSALESVKSASASSGIHSANKQPFSDGANGIALSLSAELTDILDSNFQSTESHLDRKSETGDIISETADAQQIITKCSDEFLLDALGLRQASIDPPESNMVVESESKENCQNLNNNILESTIRDDKLNPLQNPDNDRQTPAVGQALSTDFLEALELFNASNDNSIPSSSSLHPAQIQYSLTGSICRDDKGNNHDDQIIHDANGRAGQSKLPTMADNSQATNAVRHSYYEPNSTAFDVQKGRGEPSVGTSTHSWPRSFSSTDDPMADNSCRLLSHSIEINQRGSLFEFVPNDSNEDGSAKSSKYYQNKPHNSTVPPILPPPPSPTVNKSVAANVTNTTASWSPATGGRLWRLAGEIAKQQQLQQQKQQKELNRKAQMWTQTLLVEQMRSRADVDALLPPPTPPRPDHSDQMEMLARLSEQDEELLLHTGLFANKRVRVVQLLMIGLVGILFGWLGNFFVSSSCHFASINVAVGENADRFSLHFGLWNYSPVDSALNGFKYCYPYGGSHVADAPITSRVLNLAALFLGTYSLVVLWIYLVTGSALPYFWRGAVYAAIVAGICQLLTLHFFFGKMCRSKECDPGPGAITAIFTAVAWVILGAELHYNCPLSKSNVDETALWMSASGYFSMRDDAPSPLLMTNLEMADIAGASQEFLKRFKRKKRGYIPPELS